MWWQRPPPKMGGLEVKPPSLEITHFLTGSVYNRGPVHIITRVSFALAISNKVRDLYFYTILRLDW